MTVDFTAFASSGKSLVPAKIKKYDCRVRLLAKTLLVLSVLAGLMLPNAFGRTHRVSCDAPGECSEMPITYCGDSHPCDDCPPPEEFPCDHENHGEDSQAPCEDDGNRPLNSHQQEHHHQCVCAATPAWVISDSDPLSLHPPLPGHLLAKRESLPSPESPVYVFDRPPIA